MTTEAGKTDDPAMTSGSERRAPEALGLTLEAIGGHLMRYGLALILFWIGGVKFTAYEAQGIERLISNSPLMSWLYGLFSVRAASNLIGVAEIFIGALIAVRPIAPRMSAIGGLGAAVMFLTTLSFLFTTPGIWQQGYGFPELSGSGQFLMKDLIRLGAAVWTTGEALRAERNNR